MRFFVTGGAGFIGSSLVNSLLKNDHDVTIYDNFSNSSKEKISNLADLGASVIEGDITNYLSLEKALTNFEIVVHLAAKIDVDESFLKPEETQNVNVKGTMNLLQACVANKISNIVVASTAAIYGHTKKLPLDENSPPYPLSPYGESKVSMEKQLRDFSKTHNLNGVTLRFFNAYGKGQTSTYAGVITKFLNNIQENKPLVIYGDGSYTRDFIAIEDLVNSIECAISNIVGKRGNCYNIATGEHVSIKELAELMISISGKNLEIKYEPPKRRDLVHSQTTIELARHDLKFSPKINLKDGLKKLLGST